MIGIDCPVYDDEKELFTYWFSKERIIADLSKVLIFNPDYIPSDLDEFLELKSVKQWLSLVDDIKLELISCSNSKKRAYLEAKLEKLNQLLLQYWDLDFNQDLMRDWFYSSIDFTSEEISKEYPIYEKLSDLQDALNISSRDYNLEVFYIILSLVDYRKMWPKLYDFIMNNDINTLLESLKVSSYKQFLENNKID